MNRQRSGFGLYAAFMVIIVLAMFYITGKISAGSSPSQQKFETAVKDGKVTSAQIVQNKEVPTGSVVVQEQGGDSYTVNVTDVNAAISLLEDADVTYTVQNVQRDSIFMTSVLPALLLGMILLFGMSMMNRSMGGGGGGGNKPSLNTEDHYGYIVGYPVDYETGEPTDDQARKPVKPQGKITRAEVATIFFRLLQDQVRQENLTTDNVYADVGDVDWYNTAISTMAELGILKGRTPDTFVPNAPITRAEFAAICARFDTGENAGGATFPDLVGHWAKEEVERAVSLGWIMGYEDNTFRPDKAITRAEAVTMINRVLQRNPQSSEDLLKDMVTWPDNQDPSQLYYMAIQEATNSHDYERTTGIYETWTQLRETPDWSQYE